MDEDFKRSFSKNSYKSDNEDEVRSINVSIRSNQRPTNQEMSIPKNISIENYLICADHNWISQSLETKNHHSRLQKRLRYWPCKFRPRTLQAVMSKIFTFIIRNRLYNFVAETK